MKFSDIPGLENEKKRLIDSFKCNKLHHAILFFGQRGSANLSIAIAFATYINCENKFDSDSCGKCSSCLKMKKLIHPDFNLIFPVAATTKINKEVVSDKFVESWRMSFKENPYMNVDDWFIFYGFENKQPNISKDEARNIIRKLSLKPYESKFKIILLWLPEYLHISTSNALLKILEEPPGETLFFIISNDYHKLLKTILSRVQMFKVPKFTDDEIKIYLSKYDQISESEVNRAIYLSEGDLNHAMKHINSQQSDDLNRLIEWMRSCYLENYLDINNHTEWFNSLNKISKRTFMMYSLKLMREAMVSSIDSSLSRISENESSFIDKFKMTLEPKSLEKIILLIDQNIRLLDRNANPKILFLNLSIELSNHFKKVKA